MFGYDGWDDVRNDMVLIAALAAATAVGYIAVDVWAFHGGHGSRVLGWVWRSCGPESSAFHWAKAFYVWCAGLAR
jgi:hypothetical protein